LRLGRRAGNKDEASAIFLITFKEFYHRNNRCQQKVCVLLNKSCRISSGGGDILANDERFGSVFADPAQPRGLMPPPITAKGPRIGRHNSPLPHNPRATSRIAINDKSEARAKVAPAEFSCGQGQFMNAETARSERAPHLPRLAFAK
jgi:hypothetical protein